MKKYLCGFLWGMLLVFCCILFCSGTEARTVSDDNGEVYTSPGAGRKKDVQGMECVRDNEYSPDDWRYVEIYLNEKINITVDLAVVIGVLILISFLALKNE